jgi:hypothetical protein
MSKAETILNDAKGVILEAALQSNLLYSIAKYLAWEDKMQIGWQPPAEQLLIERLTKAFASIDMDTVVPSVVEPLSEEEWMPIARACAEEKAKHV